PSPAGGLQPPGTAAAGNLRLQAPPDLLAVLGAAVWNRQPIHHIQHALQRAIERAAVPALLQVPPRGDGIALFAIVKQDQLLFVQMVHFAGLTNGSSARRSFCTARNTLCLAAPGWHPRTRPTSSIHMPSKCRSTKAVLSEALNS